MTEEEFLAWYDSNVGATPEPVASSGPSILSTILGNTVIGKAKSAYDFLSDPEVQRQAFSPTEDEIARNRGLVRSLAQGIPFVGGFADEAEAKLRAIPAYFTDEDYGDRYQSELDTVRGYLDAAQEQAPAAAFGAELASGLAMPVSAGRGILQKVGLSSAEGALQGYGRGETDTERKSQAITTGGLSGALQVGLSGLGKLGRMGAEFIDSRIDPSELRAVGINQPNLSKSARKAQSQISSGWMDDVPVKKAALNAKKAGIIEPGQDAFERIAILNDKKDEVFGVLDEVTAKADLAADIIPVKIDPESDFRETYKLLRNLNEGTSAYNTLKNDIEEQVLAIGSKIEQEGTLAEILRQKRMAYGLAYDVGTSRGKELEQALGKDIKRLSEKRLKQMSKAGVVDATDLKQFEAANQAYGELSTLQRAYVDNVAKGLGDDVRKELIGLIRTSGGFGTILNISTQTRAPEPKDLIPLIIGATTGSEAGQNAIAQTLKAASPVAGGLSALTDVAEKTVRVPTVAANIRDSATERNRDEEPKMSEQEFLDWYDANIGASPSAEPEKKSPEVATEMPVDRSLIEAVIKVESAGKPDAVSSAGAQGLMQVMPATAKEVLKKLGKDPSEYDPFDPEQNMEVGTFYLDQMLNMFDGDIKLALAAYNGGPGRVSRLLKATGGTSFEDIADRLPKETREYVPKVLGKIERA